MLGKLFKTYKQNRALASWLSSPMGRQLADHTRKYFAMDRLAGLDEPYRLKLIGDFHGEAFRIVTDANPLLALRAKLAAYVYAFAEYQVLCLTEEEQNAGLHASPYISAQLHHRILQAVDHVDMLAEVRWKVPDATSADFIDFCNTRSLIYLYYINGLNLVRIALGDVDSERDWLMPFVTAMLVWREETLRHQLGLPSLLDNARDAFRYSTFHNLVTEGVRNPYFEWERTWGTA